MIEAHIGARDTRSFGKFFIVCYYFIVHTEKSLFEAVDPSFHKSIAEYYRAKGVIKWIADPSSFCQLTAPSQPPASFLEAHLTAETIMLELEDCTPIMMEVLHCVYKPLNFANTHVVLESVFVNGLEYEAFNVYIPNTTSICYTPNTWVINPDEIMLGSLRIPTYQRLAQMPVVSIIDNAQRALAEYYQANGGVEWKWQPRPFCESLIIAGDESTTLQAAYLAMDSVMLERVNCAIIQMEILYCDYVCREPTGYVGRMKNFVNGVDGEVFEVHTPDRTSMCNAPSTWTILKEVVVGVRVPR